MSGSGQSHVFWGAASPLAGLAGGGLLVMASARLAYALLAAGALLWVYGLSVLAAHPGALIFPKKGKNLILVFLSSFVGSVYLLLLWFLSPLMGMEVFFFVSLTPLFCIGSGLFDRIKSMDIGDSVSRALSEAAIPGLLVILLSIVREPLGFFSLSLPGGVQGIVLLFSFQGESFLPVRIIASSAGALLLLGYGTCLYRWLRSVNSPKEENL
ncbi:MAG: hypothetical protein LBS57_04115 [Treponema sp.]|jgi:hypothetical protein|nr:hypothetical protein [Treponema sp.]